MTELEELKETNLFLSNELRRADIDRQKIYEELERTKNKLEEYENRLLNIGTEKTDLPTKMEVSD